ncbi:zinc ribbon domain-containing protein [Halothermothrix orenii]|uniref:Predicted nucleic-acid-binding protein containing a Zn-ribbon domain n=1 Tax=Halothermothrix orenii (strain H 168 / OCM 544 / DSM 9562) TaxID=373903 RepID=B8CW35_HALOH|nr:zinc ribbon domain-containing protein [Halothermothrix orenii]ACL69504.1 predicted nucleic-acid-binding protein containing a Zn-ribbon domain [Halothermothrix orenii H 168]
MNKSFTCPKCGCQEYEKDEIRATGGGFAKIFDVQNKRFTAITCTNCRYTEFYKGDTKTLINILDFLTD